MKKSFIYSLVILMGASICLSCSKKEDEEPPLTVALTYANLTDDGYFDGVLYYKITSNFPLEVKVTKSEKTVVNIGIPTIISIDGRDYKCTSIDNRAFYNNSSLESITISKGVRSIGERAFEGCSNLTSVTMPESVTSIGYEAFYGCISLTSITIPKNVERIYSWTFYGCRSLASITIPESVTSIDGNAFEGTAWYNNQPDGLVYAGRVVYDYKGTMPENTTIEIPEGTVGIASHAFSGCSGLTSITIPESVTSIDNQTFYECSSLTSITIPEGVTSIGYRAFAKCSSLESIIIPESVTNIGSYVFDECQGLKSIYCRSSTPPNVSGDFFDFDYKSYYNRITLHVPQGAIEAYRNANYWNEFKTIVEEDF